MSDEPVFSRRDDGTWEPSDHARSDLDGAGVGQAVSSVEPRSA